MVSYMDTPQQPDGLHVFTTPAVSELRRVYDTNAARFDALAGDDAVVFGICIYRNSWYAMERLAEELDGWTTSRPDGSLVISGAGMRIHVYRHGQDEDVDLDSFRLDEGSSETKRLIAASNADQLSFDFPSDASREPEPRGSDLRELVIVHAGNPDDGCCGIWVGAPIPANEVRTSPWYWIRPLWVVQRAAAEEASAPKPTQIRHDELPEPAVPVEPIVKPSIEEQSE
jgi:hypothetical protein